jgi:Leucine-rich repeat (LRR) protein
LQKISLVDNLIQYVNPEAFLNLENLVYLLLTGNKIERIGRSAFHFLHKDGATIVLNENYITTVDVKAFEHFTPKDAIISLQYNLITTLPQGLFDNRTFKRIDLSFNKIPAKPKILFATTAALNNLLLSMKVFPMKTLLGNLHNS